MLIITLGINYTWFYRHHCFYWYFDHTLEFQVPFAGNHMYVNKNVVKTDGCLQDNVAGKWIFLWFHTIWNILKTYMIRSGDCEYNRILCNAIASSRVRRTKHKTVKLEKVPIHHPNGIQYLQWVNQELCMYHDLFMDASFADVPYLWLRQIFCLELSKPCH